MHLSIKSFDAVNFFFMKILISALCNYASENNGSFTIIDTFDNLVVERFPWRVYFSYVLSVCLDETINSYKEVTFVIKNKKTKDEVFSSKNKLENSCANYKFNAVISLKGLIFNEAGEYLFNVLFDKILIDSIPFKVSEHE